MLRVIPRSNYAESLRSASTTIGFLHIAVNICHMVALYISVDYRISVLGKDESNQHTGMLVSEIACSVNIVMSIILIIGVSWDKPMLVLPWLCYMFIALLAYSVLIVVLFALVSGFTNSTATAKTFLATLIAVMKWCSWIVVLSFYTELIKMQKFPRQLYVQYAVARKKAHH